MLTNVFCTMTVTYSISLLYFIIDCCILCRDCCINVFLYNDCCKLYFAVVFYTLTVVFYTLTVVFYKLTVVFYTLTAIYYTTCLYFKH